ncbi:MAG TPA: hypothetical protein DCL72_13895 [Rhizobiales bacterium]|nr:hypothetical protein [Hyphomicrobiales bacterium]HAN63715.1 hypothetical protein [Hyphomicrobiales bacterium]HBH41817.1 hypothetical protein [Hyphomicrobiales bacterium]
MVHRGRIVSERYAPGFSTWAQSDAPKRNHSWRLMPAHHGSVVPINNCLRSIEKFRIEVFTALCLTNDETQNL